ncbi:hypothetical protein Tco_0549020, partial [Tanacetum coccineum]
MRTKRKLIFKLEDKMRFGSSLKKQNTRVGSRGTVCSSVDGLLVESTSRDFGVRQPQSIAESSSFGITDTPPETLNGSLRSESMLPSICNDVVAMEYVHTTLVCTVDSQYSNTSNTNGLALTAGVDEYAFVCHDELPVIDECGSSLVVGNTHIGPLHATYIAFSVTYAGPESTSSKADNPICLLFVMMFPWWLLLMNVKPLMLLIMLRPDSLMLH